MTDFATSSAVEAPTTDTPNFTPVPVRDRHDGWTAQRQRVFLAALAETGSISTACEQAGVSSRSAYRLRARPDAAAFSRAWSLALEIASARLLTLAYERATLGAVREVWKDGELVLQSRAPSDWLLMFLLNRLLTEQDHCTSGNASLRIAGVQESRALFAEGLRTLTDTDATVAADPVSLRAVHPDRTERYT